MGLTAGERCALPGVWRKGRDAQLGQLASETGYARWETERWAMLVSGGVSDAE